VLGDSKTNFDEWRNSIARESKYVLRSVLFRVFAIVLALAVIIVVSEIWRRITFRYVRDPRRRRQFLVMRRVVIGFSIVIILTLGFISEFSSLATFAGFITAGIAVGLQAVLLSVAAYFFIIGRYGIRVGDRISVAGVTGDVVDIGLVRLYLMELGGQDWISILRDASLYSQIPFFSRPARRSSSRFPGPSTHGTKSW
jgi:small-conductance mechanosensitive channel